MPPTVLADSDDDGDAVPLEPESQPVKQTALGNTDAEATASTHHQSTGSTERLQQQIRSAERGLFAPTAENAALTALSSATSGRKRRHTSAFNFDIDSSPEKSVKRTKTTSSRAPATSQSARFSEHSAAISSGLLPPGSLADEFVNHEPNVMFRESGSTVQDNASSQQRMLQQALASNRNSTASGLQLAPAGEPKSSSLPWTVSQKTSGNADHDTPSKVAAEANEREHSPAGIPSQPQQAPAVLSQHTGDSTAGTLAIVEFKEAAPRQRSSPRVEITIPAASHQTTMTGKTGKSRRSKTQTETISTELNSDDRAIGLPKEQYKPRPSRRRATGVPDEPIDFSIPPERALKLKKKKVVAEAASRSVGTPPEVLESSDDVANAEPSNAVVEAGLTATETSTTAIETTKTAHDDLVKNVIAALGAPANIKKSAKQPIEPSEKSQPSPAPKSDDMLPPASAPKSDKSDDVIFVKPAPRPKSNPKSKRSHTTIFEDHIDFTGSQRSPNLRQQQASRKAALQEVETDMPKESQRKRRKVVVDEDEDEGGAAGALPGIDQVKAQEEIAVEAKGPVNDADVPKKRGRGRPPKAASTKPKPMVDDDDDNDAAIEEDAEVEEDEEPVPKKRGRGRPSKSTTTVLDNSTKEPQQEPEQSNVEQNKEDQTVEQPNSTPSLQAPTPSPEKQPTAKPLTPTQPKGKPTSHSPIKSSSKVPLRVGLNKRHRIPPLLRTIKAPKRV